MSGWLLDTNVCIDLLRAKAVGKRLPPYDRCRLPAVVAAELWTGVNKSADLAKQTQKLSAFLELFDIVPFDGEAARHYGEIRSHLEKQGTPIGSLDQLIAAQARSAGATLLTSNMQEFKRVPGLKCQAWE